MHFTPYPRSELSPVWTAIVWAITTLWVNWIWESWFTRAKDVEIALLAMASLLGYPVMLAILAGILGYTIERLQDHFLVCAALALGVLGVGLAVYGIPRPWSLVVCMVIAATMGLKARRVAQDEADLEDL